MGSDLERQRLRGNIVDEVDDLKRRMRLMEESAATADSRGVIRAGGLLLEVRAAAPAAPKPGRVILYAQEEDDIIYLRVMDALGTVRDLTNWSENGMDVRVRDVVTGGWWRLFVDTLATDESHVVAEEI